MALWIPNSRSIARSSDMPLRRAFWTDFQRAFWRKVGLRGVTVAGGAAELLTVVAGDDGLLVSLGDGHRITQSQLALLYQHGVAHRQ